MAKQYDRKRLAKETPNKQLSWDIPRHSRFTSLRHPLERTSKPRSQRPRGAHGGTNTRCK